MAFSTLDAIRTGGLNIELGLDSDSDDRFGTDDFRNYALQEAFRRLWPRMARLTYENVTPTTTGTEFSLVTVQDAVLVELLDSDGLYVTTLPSWRTLVDEDSSSYALRLFLPTVIDTTLTIRVTGYSPYVVPTSNPPSSSGACDLPPDKEWIVVAGARAMLYRRLLNQFAVFERHENENRRTFVSAEQLLGMAQDAERMFQQGISDNRRRLATAKRAIPIRP